MSSWVLRAAVAALVVFALVGTLTLDRGPRSATEKPRTRTVEVMPDLVGADLEAARDAFDGAGLDVQARRLEGQSMDLWPMIVAQDPAAGDPLEPGDDVILLVSKPDRPPLDIAPIEGECPGDEVRFSRGFRQVFATEHVRLASASEDGRIFFSDGLPAEEGRKISLLWSHTRSYRGPLLIRGERVDAPGEIVFGQDRGQAQEPGPFGTPGEIRFPSGGAPGGFAWITTVTFPAPGCYTFQIDGWEFTEHITVTVVP